MGMRKKISLKIKTILNFQTVKHRRKYALSAPGALENWLIFLDMVTNCFGKFLTLNFDGCITRGTRKENYCNKRELFRLVSRGENGRRQGLAGEHRNRVQRRGDQLLGDTSGFGRIPRHVPAHLSGQHIHENLAAVDDRKFFRRPNRAVGRDQSNSVSISNTEWEKIEMPIVIVLDF